jgi:hypothetical protein
MLGLLAGLMRADLTMTEGASRASFSRQGGYQAALQLLNWPTRPSAIFTAVLAVLDPDSSDTYQRFARELVIRQSCGCNRHE